MLPEWLSNPWIIALIVLGIIILIAGIMLVMAYMKIRSISPLYNLKWDKLDASQQKSFKSLGWDSTKWSKTNMANLKEYPAIYKISWGKLTQDQKLGAKYLEHYWLSWWLQSLAF